MDREHLIMTSFSVLSVGMLIAVGIKQRRQLRLFYALAISADFYSLFANTMAVGLGYWKHPVRYFPQLFETSVVYDILFFPATLLVFLAYLPKGTWKRVLYGLALINVLCGLEAWLETTTQLIDYGRGWTIYKTFPLYVMTYLLFYGLYRWLSGEERWKEGQ